MKSLIKPQLLAICDNKYDIYQPDKKTQGWRKNCFYVETWNYI